MHTAGIICQFLYTGVHQYVVDASLLQVSLTDAVSNIAI